MTQTHGRRALLKKGLIALGGAVGLGFLGREALDGAGPGRSGTTMRLHGRDWHMYAANKARGVLPAQGERMVGYGRLLDEPGGAVLGEFYSACFCTGVPFAATHNSQGLMELHTFKLRDGTIIGVAAGGADDSETVHAVIGGTGRYLGASGTYVARQRPVELGGDGTAEFAFNLTTKEASHAG